MLLLFFSFIVTVTEAVVHFSYFVSLECTIDTRFGRFGHRRLLIYIVYPTDSFMACALKTQRMMKSTCKKYPCKTATTNGRIFI